MAELSGKEFLFVSYPGSGNTWLRRMLTEIIVRTHPETMLSAGPNPANFSLVIPSLEKGGAERLETSPLNRPILKTHDLVGQYPNDALYLVRQPEDALVAFYHFRQRRSLDSGKQIDEFCLEQLPRWKKHANDALRILRNPDRAITCLTYEQLHAQPIRSLARACQFFDLPAPLLTLQAVIRSQQMPALQRRVAEDRWTKHNLRQGKVGGGAQELSTETLEQVRSEANTLYRKLAAVTLTEIKSGPSFSAMAIDQARTMFSRKLTGPRLA